MREHKFTNGTIRFNDPDPADIDRAAKSLIPMGKCDEERFTMAYHDLGKSCLVSMTRMEKETAYILLGMYIMLDGRWRNDPEVTA